MDILQSAIDTAEAIGMDLTKVETICFDVLKGYDYEQLVSLCDKKSLDKYIKTKEKQVITEKGEELYLKPLMVKSELHLVVGKTKNDELITLQPASDYRYALTPLHPSVKLATRDDVANHQEFCAFREEVVSRLRFALELLTKTQNLSLERVDDTTGWELGVEQRTYTKTIFDTSKELLWGFNFYKVVFQSQKDNTELVIPCLLLKQCADLKLLHGF